MTNSTSDSPIPSTVSNQRTYEVRWADLDPNWHMKNTAYSEYASQARFAYLRDCGYGASTLTKLGIGPVLFREDIRYLKEMHLDEMITVKFEASGISKKGHLWQVRNTICRKDGEIAAILNISGGWLDIRARQIKAPPEGLKAVIEQLPRTDDFRWITKID